MGDYLICSFYNAAICLLCISIRGHNNNPRPVGRNETQIWSCTALFFNFCVGLKSIWWCPVLDLKTLSPGFAGWISHLLTCHDSYCYPLLSIVIEGCKALPCHPCHKTAPLTVYIVNCFVFDLKVINLTWKW